jgi:membrane protein DedA with SNARE-associated domain
MSLAEYGIMFVLVAIMGAGIPGPGDASLIAAGALAGEGKLNIWIVLVTAMVAWMLGSAIGFRNRSARGTSAARPSGTP